MEIQPDALLNLGGGLALAWLVIDNLFKLIRQKNNQTPSEIESLKKYMAVEFASIDRRFIGLEREVKSLSKLIRGNGIKGVVTEVAVLKEKVITLEKENANEHSK